ncbi:MAG: hypothetical protein K1V96_10470, partial [Lachnospiraceae bacterium]
MPIGRAKINEMVFCQFITFTNDNSYKFSDLQDDFTPRLDKFVISPAKIINKSEPEKPQPEKPQPENPPPQNPQPEKPQPEN